jgi:hypothetical protein
MNLPLAKNNLSQNSSLNEKKEKERKSRKILTLFAFW